MKVLCFTYDYTGPYSSFSVRDFVEIGKWYDVYEHEDRYTIYTDLKNIYKFATVGSVKCDLAKDYFKTVDQIREEKLKELGI
jgi:hypothetical protein